MTSKRGATVILNADVTEPPPNQEALVLSLKWSWTIVGNVQYRAKAGDTAVDADPPLDSDHRPAISPGPDTPETSPLRTLTAKFPKAGIWTVNLEVTAKWSSSAGLFRSVTAPLAVNFQVADPVLVEFRSQYDRVAAGGKDNSAHQTTLTARVDPPVAGMTIKFSIVGGGLGLDCTGQCASFNNDANCPSACLPSRVRATLTGEGGSYYAGLTTAPLIATTGSDGTATVTFRSPNGADDSCVVRAERRSTTMHATVAVVKPTVKPLVHVSSHPRKGDFTVYGQLVFDRNGKEVGVPGHRVVSYVTAIDFDCTVCWCNAWDLADPLQAVCGFGSRCQMFNSIKRYVAVTSGQDYTTNAAGQFQFNVTTYDPDNDDLLLKFHMESRAVTSLSNCSVGS